MAQPRIPEGLNLYEIYSKNFKSRTVTLVTAQIIHTYTNSKIFNQQNYNIIYNKPTRCNSGSILFINNYKYALHVPDAICVHLQEHYKL